MPMRDRLMRDRPIAQIVEGKKRVEYLMALATAGLTMRRIQLLLGNAKHAATVQTGCLQILA